MWCRNNAEITCEMGVILGYCTSCIFGTFFLWNPKIEISKNTPFFAFLNLHPPNFRNFGGWGIPRILFLYKNPPKLHIPRFCGQLVSHCKLLHDEIVVPCVPFLSFVVGVRSSVASRPAFPDKVLISHHQPVWWRCTERIESLIIVHSPRGCFDNGWVWGPLDSHPPGGEAPSFSSTRPKAQVQEKFSRVFGWFCGGLRCVDGWINPPPRVWVGFR